MASFLSILSVVILNKDNFFSIRSILTFWVMQKFLRLRATTCSQIPRVPPLTSESPIKISTPPDPPCQNFFFPVPPGSSALFIIPAKVTHRQIFLRKFLGPHGLPFGNFSFTDCFFLLLSRIFLFLSNIIKFDTHTVFV